MRIGHGGMPSAVERQPRPVMSVPKGYCERIEFYKRSTREEIAERLSGQILEGSDTGLTVWGERELDTGTRRKISNAAAVLQAEFSESGDEIHARIASKISQRMLASPEQQEHADPRPKDFAQILRPAVR